MNEIDENGLIDKYFGYNNLDFSNEFQKLEQLDYEIHASQDDNVIFKEDNMKGTRKEASYVGELSSGFDATVQNDYEAGNQNGQAGKAETEAVTKSKNWTGDNRDAIGRAATVQLIRHTAANLAKLAEALEDIDAGDDCDLDDEQFEEVDDDSLEAIASEVIATEKTAAHPADEQPRKNPDGQMSSETGDEWIDIGSGKFDDGRNEVGKAE